MSHKSSTGILSATVAEINLRARSQYQLKRIDPNSRIIEPHQMRRELRLSGLPDKGKDWRNMLLTEDELFRLSKVFHSMDSNNDGYIDAPELQSAFAAEKITCSVPQAVEILWENTDSPQIQLDGSDVRLTLKQLLISYRRGRQDTQEPRKLFAFILFKLLNSEHPTGTVTIDDFYKFFAPKMSSNELDFYAKRLFSASEKAKLVRLTASDFIRIMHSRLWTAQTFNLCEPTRLRKQVLPPPVRPDAKLNYLRSMEADAIMFKTERMQQKQRNPENQAAVIRKPDADPHTISMLAELMSHFKKHLEEQVDTFFQATDEEPIADISLLRSVSAKFDLRTDVLERIVKQFSSYDLEGSGRLEKEDFVKALIHLVDDPYLTEKDILRSWDFACYTDNDTITLDNFIMWYLKFVPNLA